MTDKEIINEFTRLYRDYGSTDKALHQIRKIISTGQYESLKSGLQRLRK